MIINNLSENSNYSVLPVQENLLNTGRPKEIFEKILSYLEGTWIQSATSVNHTWNAAIIRMKKNKTISAMRKFAIFLSQNLNQKLYRHQSEELIRLSMCEKILDLTNLIQIKSFLSELDKSLLNLLKTISFEDLRRLIKLTKVKVQIKILQKASEVGRIENQLAIIKANDKLNENQKLKALLSSCTDLFLIEEIDAAIKVAIEIPREKFRTGALKHISELLVTKYPVSIAKKFAERVLEDDIRNELFMHISTERKTSWASGSTAYA